MNSSSIESYAPHTDLNAGSWAAVLMASILAMTGARLRTAVFGARN